MRDAGNEWTIQFRAGREKEAAEPLDDIHIGGVNISELARVGLTEMLRRSLTDEDKITIYERYDRGEIDEEREAFRKATERDTSSFLAR